MILPGRAYLKTYSHLSKSNTRPSEYSITTTDLLFSTSKGHSITTPTIEWQKKYVDNSPLITKGVSFSDPDEYTYTKYVTTRNKQEIFLEGIFSAIEQTTYSEALQDSWRQRVQKYLGAFVFISHGMQMCSAYIGQLGTSGQLVAMLAMQTADELRRTENIAYHLMLSNSSPEKILNMGRETWMKHPALQKIRHALEYLLITYDWGQAYVCFNLLYKPLIDEMFLNGLAKEAAENNDPLLERLLLSLFEDSQWHRKCARKYTANLVQFNSGNSETIANWISLTKPTLLGIIEDTSGALYQNPQQRSHLENFLNSWIDSLPLRTLEQKEPSWTQTPML